MKLILSIKVLKQLQVILVRKVNLTLLNLTICRHPMSQDQEGTQQGKDKSQIDTDAISATECIRGCMLSKKGGLCDNALYVLGTSACMRERELVLFLVVCIRVILIRCRYCDIRDCYSMR